MAQIVKADTLHLVCDQKIREMLAQEIGPNPFSHRVYIDTVSYTHLAEHLRALRYSIFTGGVVTGMTAKNSPCTVRCRGSLNLQAVTYS